MGMLGALQGWQWTGDRLAQGARRMPFVHLNLGVAVTR
jgi:hypothetical protein